MVISDLMVDCNFFASHGPNLHSKKMVLRDPSTRRQESLYMRQMLGQCFGLDTLSPLELDEYYRVRGKEGAMTSIHSQTHSRGHLWCVVVHSPPPSIQGLGIDMESRSRTLTSSLRELLGPGDPWENWTRIEAIYKAICSSRMIKKEHWPTLFPRPSFGFSTGSSPKDAYFWYKDVQGHYESFTYEWEEELWQMTLAWVDTSQKRKTEGRDE